MVASLSMLYIQVVVATKTPSTSLMTTPRPQWSSF